MDSQLRTPDLIVLLLYMGGVFGLGCWFARKSGKTDEFMAAGRSLPGWAVGLSIFGTFVSSISFLGNTGKAFGGNWSSWVFGLSLPLAAMVAVKYFIPLYRSSDSVSAYSHLEDRFGPWARMFALICYLLMQIVRIGTVLFLVALALAPLTGWDVKTIILVTGLIVTLYTLLGGIEAVIWTDAVQSVVLVAGAVYCVYLIFANMPEGAGQLFELAKADDKFSLGSFSLNPKSVVWPDPTFWIVLLYGFFINLGNFGIDQGYVQRYIAAKSDKDARFSLWLGALLFPVVSALFFFMGVGLSSLYKTDAATLNEVKAQVAEMQLSDDGLAVTPEAVSAKAATLSSADVGDKVLPHFIVTKMPSGLAGLLIAAIFAAAMSSVDTSLNSSATLYFNDIHKRYFRPQAGEKESMRVLYATTLVIGVVGTFAALAFIKEKSILDSWWIWQGVFSGGMLGLFLLGMISRRAGNPQAVLGVIIGVLVIAYLSISHTKLWTETWGLAESPIQKILTIVIGTCCVVLVGVLASAGRGNRFNKIS